MNVCDLPFHQGNLPWIILLCYHFGECLGNVPTSLEMETSLTASTANTPSPNEFVLVKIEQLLSTIEDIKNSTIDSDHLNNENFIKMDKMKRKEINSFSDNENQFLKQSKILDQLKELCKILNRYEESNDWYQLSNYIKIMTEKQPDRFGCQSMVSVLTNSVSIYDNLTAQLYLVERKLFDWHKKLSVLSPTHLFFTTPHSALAFPSVSSRPSQSFLQTSDLPQVTSSKSPLRWNKGLSRYDTSWVRTDSKNSDKEIIFYDNYDPSLKEEYKISLGKSIIRIVPAITVITFLVLCWYFFVYRRMKQRQQRARQLLAQYQAILSGARASGSSFMVVSESRSRNDAGAQMFICSSSTYDSCLNETCNTLDESNCAEHCNASDSRAQTNDLVPQQTSANTSRPRNYPPTYEEIFPPSYESLYGTVV